MAEVARDLDVLVVGVGSQAPVAFGEVFRAERVRIEVERFGRGRGGLERLLHLLRDVRRTWRNHSYRR